MKTKRASIEAGDHVYHRRADLFATVESIDDVHAEIRYEFPEDGKTTKRVSLAELSPASDVT